MKICFSPADVSYVNLIVTPAEEPRRVEGKVFLPRIGILLHLFSHIDTHYLFKCLPYCPEVLPLLVTKRPSVRGSEFCCIFVPRPLSLNYYGFIISLELLSQVLSLTFPYSTVSYYSWYFVFHINLKFGLSIFKKHL